MKIARGAVFAILAAVAFSLHGVASELGVPRRNAETTNLPRIFITGELEKKIKMPVRRFYGPDGSEVSARDFKGKMLIITFWAPWNLESVAALKGMQGVRDYLEEKEMEDGFIFIPIVSETEFNGSLIESVFKDHELKISTYKDSEHGLFDYFEVNTVPLTLIADEDGLVVYRISGEIKWDTFEVVEKLLSMKG